MTSKRLVEVPSAMDILVPAMFGVIFLEKPAFLGLVLPIAVTFLGVLACLLSVAEILYFQRARHSLTAGDWVRVLIVVMLSVDILSRGAHVCSIALAVLGIGYAFYFVLSNQIYPFIRRLKKRDSNE